jgi:hypothetical protein
LSRRLGFLPVELPTTTLSFSRVERGGSGVTMCSNQKPLNTYVIKTSARVSTHAPQFLWSPRHYDCNSMVTSIHFETEITIFNWDKYKDKDNSKDSYLNVSIKNDFFFSLLFRFLKELTTNHHIYINTYTHICVSTSWDASLEETSSLE